MGPEAAVAASGSVAGALRGSRRQLQRPGAPQEPPRGQEVAVAASRNVAGALQKPGSSVCSGQERRRSVAEARKQRLQRLCKVTGTEQPTEAQGHHGPNYYRDMYLSKFGGKGVLKGKCSARGPTKMSEAIAD